MIPPRPPVIGPDLTSPLRLADPAALVGVTRSGWVFYQGGLDLRKTTVQGGIDDVVVPAIDGHGAVPLLVGDHLWAHDGPSLTVFPSVGAQHQTAFPSSSLVAATDDGAWVVRGMTATGTGATTLEVWHNGAIAHWDGVDLVGIDQPAAAFSADWGVVARHPTGATSFSLAILDLAHAEVRDLGAGFASSTVYVAGDHALAFTATDLVSIDLAAGTTSNLAAVDAPTAAWLAHSGHVAIYAAGGALWRATLVPTPVATKLVDNVGTLDRIYGSPDDNSVVYGYRDLLAVANTTRPGAPLWVGNGGAATAPADLWTTAAPAVFTEDGRHALLLTGVHQISGWMLGDLTLVDTATGRVRTVAHDCTTVRTAGGARILYEADAQPPYYWDTTLYTLDTSAADATPTTVTTHASSGQLAWSAPNYVVYRIDQALFAQPLP